MYDNPNYRVDWRDMVVHDDKNIKGFFGDYRFLSNFEEANIWYEGIMYKNSENAYQAQKIAPYRRGEFSLMSPKVSKFAWKKYPKADISDEHWNARKYDVMLAVNFDKYYRNIELRKKLLDTNDKYIEETNWWKDTFWGVDYKTGQGENNLGKILMKIRNMFL